MKLPGSTPSGDAIAAFALRWRGQGYVFGGDASHPGDWDCSSFVSFVLHGVGIGLPGGRWGAPGFPPNAHGPVVLTYASWGGASAVSSPARGDLVLWPGAGADGHIGIVLGPNQMVSALDSAQGTTVTPIQGFGPPGITPVYRRVNGSAAGSPGGGGSGTSAAAGGGVNQALLAVLTVAGMALGVVVLAAVGGTLVAVTGVWLAGKAVGDG